MENMQLREKTGNMNASGYKIEKLEYRCYCEMKTVSR